MRSGLPPYHRRYSIPLVDYVRAVGAPTLLAGGIALPVVLLRLSGAGGELLESRATATATLMTIAALYGGIYWLGASRLGLLPQRLTLRFARPRRAQATGSARP